MNIKYDLEINKYYLKLKNIIYSDNFFHNI